MRKSYMRKYGFWVLGLWAGLAMSAMAQIQHGMSLEQSMKMLQERLREEREQREADQQRRHEIDLSIVQNLMPLQRPHASSVGRK